ncbi:MAG: NADH-quinone oxidoreductase subunit M [Bacteroidetes bacterium]|nr:NADH-quinone oxidoreductase subunit M [Bacteroidota bacterium]
MLTTLLIAYPFFAAILVMLAGSTNAKRLALLSSLVQFGLTIWAWVNFQNNADVQFAMDEVWMPSFGIHFSVGMDGISMLMVLLTNLLMPLIILSSFKIEYSRPAVFYALVLVMQSALVGVFVAQDAFLYYIFWELALIPIYFICLLWGGKDRIRITFKFFIYTIAGSLLMLVAFIYLYFQVPSPSNFSHEALSTLHLDTHIQGYIFWALFIAFAIKMPVFPFHTWQPDTYTEAPSTGTMLLSGIMLKMGVYSVLRWLLPLAPLGVAEYGKLAIILSIVGIVYGSWIAISQKDIKRLFAYSSFAHVGLISAGIFSMTLQGLQGSMVQMLSHGINVVGLFFVVQIMEQRLKTREIGEMGGIINKAPVFATLFLIVLLGSVALPLTNGFVGEFMLLAGVYQFSPWYGAVAGLTIILGAVYMLKSYQWAVLGEAKEGFEFPDLYASEKIVLVVIAALVIVLGVYPQPILNLTEPSIKHLLETLTNPINLSLR